MSEFVVEKRVTSDRRSPARWIYSHVRRHKLQILGVIIGALGNASLAAAVPILIGLAFDAALENPPNLRTIGIMALLVIASQTVRAVLQFGRNFSSAVLGERLERDMREELYVNLLGKSMTFHDLRPVGDTMARATNDVHELNLMMNPGFNLVIGSSNFMLMPLILSFRYAPALSLAPIFFIVTYIFAVARYLNLLTPIADRVRRAFGRLNSRLAEAIDGIELVKGTAKENEEIGRFSQNAAEYRAAAVEQGRIEARFLPLLLYGLTIAIAFIHAMILFQAGVLLLGDVIAYVGLVLLFRFPVFISLLAYSRVSLGFASARRILELLNSKTDLDENATGHMGEIRGEIRFKDVSFGYMDGAPVLENLDFTIRPGQTVAIVGQTGAGKSSLAKLINRTYDVQFGCVEIDGIDVKMWNLAALRRQISIIEQDIFLFSRSVADNIAFGCPEASQEMIITAAKSAQAHDFILSFKDGYETVIGERGVTLSGGQRQRLALARAFLTNPHILILDDSTSAVDSATEDQIQQAIIQAAANQTTLLITHRLSQIRWSDLVIVLRKGRLEAVGTHDELMRQSRAYRRIFDQYDAIGT